MWIECSQYIKAVVYNTVLLIHFSVSCMSELERKIVKATLNLALVMCLSLWAYYIQIKGEFTDRRQAPAPISNQTVPSGEPCGAHICGHSLTAWHHNVLQESSTRIKRSCSWESSTLQEDYMMYLKIKQWIVWTLAKYVMVRAVFAAVGEEGRNILMCSCLLTPLKAVLPSFPRPLWKSVCSAAYVFRVHFIQNHNVSLIFSFKRRRKLCNVHPHFLTNYIYAN